MNEIAVIFASHKKPKFRFEDKLLPRFSSPFQVIRGENKTTKRNKATTGLPLQPQQAPQSYFWKTQI